MRSGKTGRGLDMSLQVIPLGCTDLKETQSMGKQDPYVKIFFGLDTGRVCSTSPQAPLRDKVFQGSPLLVAQDWKGPVAVDGGKNPAWKEEDPQNKAAFLYLPGVEYLRVEVWNSNVMSDNYIARGWVSLADAFTCTGKPGSFCYDLFRDSGKNCGKIQLQFRWTPPNGYPLSVCVPLTIQVRGHADAAGKFVSSGFMLYDQTIPEALKNVPVDRMGIPRDERVMEKLMAVQPSMMQGFGAYSIPFLKQCGGVAVSQCDQEALQSGLWPNDVIIGFSQDTGIKDLSKRGIQALVDGTAKWKQINGSSRAKALSDLATFIPLGSVTLTVLRAMPFQFVPGNHPLKLAFIIPPASIEFEPSNLTVIAGQKLPTVQAAVKPHEGKPYWFKLADAGSIPDGLELDAQTGHVLGLPSTPGEYRIPIVAWNACGQVQVSLNIHVMSTPTSFVYADGHQKIYALHKPIYPNTVATIDGTGPFTFSAESLPAGLVIDANTGEISGTPTCVVSGQVVIVVATGPAGTISASLVVDVQARPTQLSFAVTTSSLRRNEKVVIEASLDGTHPLTFSSQPALPLGLSIDETTGQILGTPFNSDEDKIVYRITAANVAGSVCTDVELRVMDPPAELSYAQGARGAKLTYGVGCELILNEVSSVSGSRPFRFSAEPALPSGLKLDPDSGDISGTPAAVAAATVYMISCKNDVGKITTPLFIEVVKAQEIPADATDVSGALAQGQDEQEEVSEVHSFLVFCGCPQYADALINDGWEDLESIYTMNQSDLAAVGVRSGDVSKIMSKFPGASKKTSDAQELRALLKRAACEEYRELLEQCHISTVPELCVMSEENLVTFGLKRGHARRLFSEIMVAKSQAQAIELGGDSSGGTMFASLKRSEGSATEVCGVGIQLGKFGNLWGVWSVVPGGPADQDGSIEKGDLIMAIDPGYGSEFEVSEKISLQQIAEATKGPRGTPVTLVIKRRGTIFGVNLVRMPIFKQERPPEAKITLRVISANNLPPMDANGLCDPYVTLHCNHQSKSTSTCWKTRQARWESDHYFLCDRGARLIVSVWDKDRFTSDDLVGKFSLKMQDIVDFSTGRILKEDFVFDILGSNGQPVVCDLGTTRVHMRCVKVAFRNPRR